MTISYGLLGTYPPTRCGLATFTASLLCALTSLAGTDRVGVVRVVESAVPEQSPEVVTQLVVGAPEGGERAAAALDRHDVVVVQYDSGMFGGAKGDWLLSVLRRLHVPVIAVVHSLGARPDERQSNVLQQLVALAGAVVAMSEAACTRLVTEYGADLAKVTVIPHGAPDRPPMRQVVPSTGPVVLTWGLLGPGKGIEWAVAGMRLIRHLLPRPRYVIAGQTHPEVLARQGEAYRLMLYSRVRALNVAGLVTFERAYLDRADLDRLIGRADVVVLPYDSTDQVTSGVLVEALAAHKPVIATPFPHAAELLRTGAGLLVPHRNAAAIGAALRRVLTEPGLAEAMRDEARSVAGTFGWSVVATRYQALAAAMLSRRSSIPI